MGIRELQDQASSPIVTADSPSLREYPNYSLLMPLAQLEIEFISVTLSWWYQATSWLARFSLYICSFLEYLRPKISLMGFQRSLWEHPRSGTPLTKLHRSLWKHPWLGTLLTELQKSLWEPPDWEHLIGRSKPQRSLWEYLRKSHIGI